MAWLIWPVFVLIDLLNDEGGGGGLCLRENGKRGVGGREMKDEDP
jgi:hypothetical protein